MRKMIDLVCTVCALVEEDRYVDPAAIPPCGCGGARERLRMTQRSGAAAPVRQDEIPGGLLIRHGLCNADGSPRRYYSHTEIAREAKRRGLRNLVEHVPDRGSDRNKHTQRWV